VRNRSLGERGESRLHSDRGTCRVDARGEVVERDFLDMRRHVGGAASVVGQRLQVGDEARLHCAGRLQRDPRA
jgi:hypothetical protein